MSYPKQDPEKKKYSICGAVVKRDKEILLQECIRQGTTVSAMLGEILGEWCKDKKLDGEVDVRQYLLYSRDQTEGEKKETKEYEKGNLGMKERGK